MSASVLRRPASLSFVAAVLAVGFVTLAQPREARAGGGACDTPGTVVTQTEQLFTDVAPGNVLATGNALGLSKEALLNGPGDRDSIGTFISLDASSVDDAPPNPGNPWFPGTTSDWTQNGSSAALSLPSGSTVLHAELVWGGSYGDVITDVEGNVDDPVSLLFGGEELVVAPEGAGITIDQGAAPRFRYYARKADVTDFVKSHGVGDYTVAGVPAVQSEGVDSLHTAGWTLLVAYRDQAQPIRNLTLYFGGAFVDENTTQDYGFSGFCASPSGDLRGSAVITALEGDANRDGDVLCIAPNEAGVNFVGLDGPNNPADNFFSSQINDAEGLVDTRGTFGSRNQDAFGAANVSGGRQGWDITQLELSSADGSLAAGQTGATLRTATDDDSYLPMGAGFSIDVNAPFFDPDAGNATVIDADEVEVGDTFTVTVNLENSGSAPADNLRFFMSPPAGLSLQSFTSDGVAGDVTGDPVEQAELASGVAEGSLGSGEARVVAVTFRVDAKPAGTRFNLQPSWTYDWVMCTGQAPLTENFAAAPTAVDFLGQDPTGSGGNGGGSGTSTSTATAQGGGTGTNAGGGDGDGDADEDGSDSDGEDEDGGAGGSGNGLDFIASGGACAIGGGQPGSLALLGGLGVAALALASRRRRG